MCSHGLPPPFGRIEALREERGDNRWGLECCLGKRLEEGIREIREDDRPGAQLCRAGCGEGLAAGGGASSGGFLSSLASGNTPLTLFTHGKHSDHKAWPCLGPCAQYPHGHLSLAHK